MPYPVLLHLLPFHVLCHGLHPDSVPLQDTINKGIEENFKGQLKGHFLL